MFWTCDLNGHMEPVLGRPCHFLITTLIFSVISQQEFHVSFNLNPMKNMLFCLWAFWSWNMGTIAMCISQGAMWTFDETLSILIHKKKTVSPN